ncbi:MAG: response regulator [Gammaproteobacteria bacterium]|nr:response regulator [Gammaproteobacteria bacterium]
MTEHIRNSQTNGSVLIADDTTACLCVLYELLSDNDFEVRLAHCGAKALQSIRNNPPDVVLLDIMMPVMDGYEVCRQLKADDATRDIPILFLTAKSDVAGENKGLELGAVDYIRKPFHAESVLARVRNQFALKRRLDTLSSKHTGVDYQFCRQGQGWLIRFAGNDTHILTPSRGAAYLHILLSNAHKPFMARDLVFLVVKDASVLQTGDAGHRLDKLAISAYQERRGTLIIQLQEAEENDDLGAIQLLSEEKGWLERELSAAVGLHGQLRLDVSQQERFRKSVGNAIRRTLKEIAIIEPAMADHLKPPNLRLGGAPIYAPILDKHWQT